MNWNKIRYGQEPEDKANLLCCNREEQLTINGQYNKASRTVDTGFRDGRHTFIYPFSDFTHYLIVELPTN